MRTVNVMAAIFLAATVGWSAGTPTSLPKAPAKSAMAKSGTNPVRPDADIERDIRTKFAKSKINVEKFTVHVQGGVATIEGKTDVIQHKGVATRLARSGGAVAVSNHIQISEAAREKAAENLETGRRRVQIKRGDPRSQASDAAH
ncbi:MAG TPA: BON domain-containing protein [Bryobacteraceae bacterium]|nr:BON domain-containing protein [Bryobacteraceae bacterium]